MSEVIEGQEQSLMVAGNTNANLAAVDRDVAAGLPSANDLDAVASEVAIAEATGAPVQGTDDPLDEENTFDVNRAEFNELRDAFIRLYQRVEKYNLGASHKI